MLRQNSSKFHEQISFLKAMFRHPKKVAALIPTSSITARSMASVVDINSSMPVLELGPGTGVVTRAILQKGIPPDRIISIEYIAEFCNYLNVTFPGIKCINSDIFDLEKSLGTFFDIKFDSIISAVHLLNFPMKDRVKLVEKLLDYLPIGRPMIQITYGMRPPIEVRPQSYIIEYYDSIIRNIPPARLWIFRRALR